MNRVLSWLVPAMLLAVTGAAAAQSDSDAATAVREHIENNFAIDALAADAVIYDNAYGITYTGADAYAEAYSPFYAEAYTVTVDDLTEYGNNVVASFTFEAEAYPGPVAYTGVYEYNPDADAIQTVTYHYDNAALIAGNFTPPIDLTRLYGNNERLLEQIENTPEAFFGRTVTVTGFISRVTDAGDYVVADREYFDTNPARFLVVGSNDSFFADQGIDAAEGQRVRVTGILTPPESAALEAVAGYEISRSDFIGVARDDFGLVAVYVEVLPPFEDQDYAATADGGRDGRAVSEIYGITPGEVEGLESNTDAYYGITLTVDGTITEIITPNSFVITNTAPFDVAPDSLVVYYGDIAAGNTRLEISEGTLVRVTGTFTDFNREILEVGQGYGIADRDVPSFTGEVHGVRAKRIQVAYSQTTPALFNYDYD